MTLLATQTQPLDGLKTSRTQSTMANASEPVIAMLYPSTTVHHVPVYAMGLDRSTNPRVSRCNGASSESDSGADSTSFAPAARVAQAAFCHHIKAQYKILLNNFESFTAWVLASHA